MACESNILIAGVGNDLMGDDGVGLFVIDHLASQTLEHIEVIDCGTDLFRLGNVQKQYSDILLLDSVTSGQEPGSIHWFTPEHLEDFSVSGSVHQLSILEVLKLLPIMNACFSNTRFFVIGIEPGSIHFGETLSPEVSDAAEKVISLLETSAGVQEALRRCYAHSQVAD